MLTVSASCLAQADLVVPRYKLDCAKGGIRVFTHTHRNGDKRVLGSNPFPRTLLGDSLRRNP